MEKIKAGRALLLARKRIKWICPGQIMRKIELQATVFGGNSGGREEESEERIETPG